MSDWAPDGPVNWVVPRSQSSSLWDGDFFIFQSTSKEGQMGWREETIGTLKKVLNCH